VATQSFVDPAYGPLGLELLRAGKPAEQALAGLLAADSGRDVRQVAMVDARGGVAVHTGTKCIAGAGHVTGRGYAVQANLMERETVWPAMARAFESARGTLAERMLAALEAAEAEGGDIRGRQSAAILIVRGQATGRPWVDRLMDLRVEDHPEPLRELRRLMGIHRAYEHMNLGDIAVERSNHAAALQEYTAAERLQPDNIEMKFWHAVSLVNMGRLRESLPLFRTCFANDTRWATLVPRLPASGALTADAATLDTILSVIPRR
jgi:uncharacterized Ntn-hydrolase superfamily protein